MRNGFMAQVSQCLRQFLIRESAETLRLNRVQDFAAIP